MNRRLVLTLIVIGVAMLSLGGLLGCSAAQKYNVNYCGQKDFFKGAQDSYCVGQQVHLSFDLIATDTDYSFVVEGAEAKISYDDRDGYVIEFTMPACDVRVHCEHRNTMVRMDENEASNTAEQLTRYIEYTDAVVSTVGGDRSESLVLCGNGRGNLYVYAYSTDSDGKQTAIRSLVSDDTLTKCYEAIAAAGFDTWNSLESYECIDGAVRSLSYLDLSQMGEDYVCVSTGKMPEDGDRQIQEIGSILSQAAANATIEELVE